MTVAPATLRELEAYWKAQGGVSLGIVGDAAHRARPSYHNGQDVINANGWTSVQDYSIRRPRDQEPHLTNAAAAIDLGKLNGRYSDLRKFSDWLARRCIDGEPGTSDVLEVIYSPDGVRVLGYKNGINYLIPNYGDQSHLYHTHISFGRDSEKRGKIDLFAPYFEEEHDVPGLRVHATGDFTGNVKVNDEGASAVQLADREMKSLPLGYETAAYAIAELAEPFTTPGGTEFPAGTQGYLVGLETAFVFGHNVDAESTASEFVPVGDLYVKA